MTIANDHIFTGLSANFTGIDLQTAGITTDPDIAGGVIAGNQIHTNSPSSTASTGIQLAPGAGNVALLIANNHIWNMAAGLTGWKGTFGRASFPESTIALASDGSAITSATLANITALGMPIEASRIYRLFCHLQYVTSAAGEGIAFALNGPTIGSGRVSGRIGICSTTNNCSNSGPANYDEIHVNAYGAEQLVTALQGTTVHGGVMEFIIVNGTTAGTLVPQVRAETGGANTVTMKAGSYCTVEEVPAGT
jgi:hypothetical protein